MRCVLTAVLIVLAFTSVGAHQSEMVIVIESTRQYHRASCLLLRKGPKDIVAMTRGQAEAREYKAHPECDPQNPANKASAANAAPAQREPAVYVYTAKADKRYHRETCAKLPKDRKKVLLEEAGKKLWPCPDCRPPIRKRTRAVPLRYGRG